MKAEKGLLQDSGHTVGRRRVSTQLIFGQGDCKATAKKLAYSKDRYKMEDRCHAFLLLLVNSWAQDGVSAFQQK
jgi:hypothetical protein